MRMKKRFRFVCSIVHHGAGGAIGLFVLKGDAAMETMDRLKALLPEQAALEIEIHRNELREIRLRAGYPAQLVFGSEDRLAGEAISKDSLHHILAALMDFSVYSHECELGQGFFTLTDGSRAGVCGRIAFCGNGPATLSDISSLCIRIARRLRGCADPLMPVLLRGDLLRSLLIISSPGRGKTTLLRDVARQLSERGFNVAVSDERYEIGACPDLTKADLGPRTDVLSGCPKHAAISLLLRTMAPDVIVTDEIGDVRDAQALADASRCGVAVIATAHAAGISELNRRPGLRSALETGIFGNVVLLGDPPGTIKDIRRFGGLEGGEPIWICA